MPRGYQGDDRPVYQNASGYFLRDFDVTIEQEFSKPEERPRNWQEFEFMLGNCCDRLLRDIDDRFKYLSEYLWEKIELDSATPEVVQRAFENNLSEIDRYLSLQFDHAKKQLDRVVQMNRLVPAQFSNEGSGGFSRVSPSGQRSGRTASRNSQSFPSMSSGYGSTVSTTNASSQTSSSGSGPSSASRSSGSQTYSGTAMSGPSATTGSSGSTGSSATTENSGKQTYDRRRDSTCTCTFTCKCTCVMHAPGTPGSKDQCTCICTCSTHRGSPRNRSRSFVGRGRKASGDADRSCYNVPFRDEDNNKSRITPVLSSSSLTSLFPRVIRRQSLFLLGILVGVAAVMAFLYLCPYLPPTIKQFVPFPLYCQDDREQLLRPQYIPARSENDREYQQKKRPYDAFWTSCGTSFVEWWAMTRNLLFN